MLYEYGLFLADPHGGPSNPAAGDSPPPATINLQATVVYKEIRRNFLRSPNGSLTLCCQQVTGNPIWPWLPPSGFTVGKCIVGKQYVLNQLFFVNMACFFTQIGLTDPAHHSEFERHVIGRIIDLTPLDRETATFRLEMTKYEDYYEDVHEIEIVMMESEEEAERMNYGMVPAAEVAISEALTAVEEEEENDSAVDCSICMCEMVVDRREKVVAMPCKHRFHEGCIVKWLNRSHYCPICRFEMPTEEMRCCACS